MSKRFWVTAAVGVVLLGLPVALVVLNLDVIAADLQRASDVTWGMILLGSAVVGLAAVVYAPMSVSAVVREMQRSAEPSPSARISRLRA